MPETPGTQDTAVPSDTAESDENTEPKFPSSTQPGSEHGGRPSDDRNGEFPSHDNNSSPQTEPEMPQQPGDNTVLLLVISAVVLAGGLLTAFLYKR